MDEEKLFVVDGIKWRIDYEYNPPAVVPFCPQHNLRLIPVPVHTSKRISPRDFGIEAQSIRLPESESQRLECQEDGKVFPMPRKFGAERAYVLDKVDAEEVARLKTVNLDDQLITIAKEELKDTDYWVRAKVTESKAGTRLIVWAGSRSKKNKTQLFVEPELKRMGFDQNDDNPTEVFAKVEAIFKNGKTTIEE